MCHVLKSSLAELVGGGVGRNFTLISRVRSYIEYHVASSYKYHIVEYLEHYPFWNLNQILHNHSRSSSATRRHLPLSSPVNPLPDIITLQDAPR